MFKQILPISAIRYNTENSEENILGRQRVREFKNSEAGVLCPIWFQGTRISTLFSEKTILSVIKATLNMQNNILEFFRGVAGVKALFRPVSGFR